MEKSETQQTVNKNESQSEQKKLFDFELSIDETLKVLEKVN